MIKLQAQEKGKSCLENVPRREKVMSFLLKITSYNFKSFIHIPFKEPFIYFPTVEFFDGDKLTQ